MFIDKNLRKNAQSLFNSKDYPALKMLLDANPKFVIINFLLPKDKRKKSWLKDIDFLTYLSKEKSILESLLKNDRAEEVVYEHFTKNNFQCISFEKAIALLNPELFISSIRTTQVFLKEDRLNSLSQIELPSHLNVHKKVWRLLFDQEIKLWHSIESEIKKIQGRDVSQILADTIIWIEEKRFHNSLSLQQLAEIYNFFMQYWLSKVDIEPSFTEHKFNTVFSQRLASKASSSTKNILEKIDSWIDFKYKILDPYCFDLNINPVLDNGVIKLNQSPNTYYKWKLDGTRYDINRLKYFSLASEYIDFVMKEKKVEIPKGRRPGDETINYNLTILQQQINFFLKDLCLNEISFNGKILNPSKLIEPLLDYSTNRYVRYELSLEKFKSDAASWKEAFLKLKLESLLITDIIIEPSFLISPEDYIALNSYAVDHLSEDVFKDLNDVFTYKMNPKHNFNRFNIQYDIWDKPFVKVGGLLFCPMMFFANNSWFYSTAQVGLNTLNNRDNQKLRKDSATKMEKKLGEQFAEKNWKVKVISDNQANEIDGDVDIIVYDNETTLFIQLKRTKFRLNLKDAYNEIINSDKKAARQLNQAEQSLKKENDFFTIKQTPVKWITTTSFENILGEFNSCKKVNYFDLVIALRTLPFETLKSFIDFIEKDKQLQHISENPALLQLINIDFPIPLREPEMYRQDLFLEDKSSINFYKLYNKALEIGKKGKEQRAIGLLNKCLKINPNDLDLYSALANFYADIENFDESFKCFETALKIVPNEPFILRNHAIALLESGKFYEGLQKALLLYKEFPFIGDNKSLFFISYLQLKNNLTKNEIDNIEMQLTDVF